MSGKPSASLAEFGDGLWAIDGVLPKDLGAKLVTLLEAARTRVRRHDRQAALNLLLDTAAGVEGKQGLGTVHGARPTIHVRIPLATLTADDGDAGVEPAWQEFTDAAGRVVATAKASPPVTSREQIHGPPQTRARGEHHHHR